MVSEKRFILWDPRDGAFPRTGDPEDSGELRIVSDGLIGRVGEDNVYLTAYASYPGPTTHRDLGVGDFIESVKFSLSGSVGYYEVWRVA